jgi:group II intron reverse transcriptase/maturase
MNMRNKVNELQDTLSRAAKQSLDRKFGALYDKIYRSDVLWEAWKRVKKKKGASGIDGQTIEYIEEVIGVVPFLVELQQELHAQDDEPEAVLRQWIPKPGSTDKRPLGIPVVRDRVAQTAAKLVLEPIFEANFLNVSYGFRPGRSAHDAIDKIRRSITFERRYSVIDADITKYFDSIRKSLLMELVERRVSDPRVIRLLWKWLDAGVMDDGQYFKATEFGTPQGSVISPLLANIYLHSFDKMFQLSGIPGTLVRYADDFVILLRKNGQAVVEWVRRKLQRLGLTLHPDKTRIVHAKEGFDFLGVHFRLRPVKKRGSRLTCSCRRWPSDRSMKRVKTRIKEVIGRRYSLSLEEMIQELNPIIRGWNNYHTRIQADQKRFRSLNQFVWDRLRIFLKRKHDDPSRGYRRASHEVFQRLGLAQFGRSWCANGNGC